MKRTLLSLLGTLLLLIGTAVPAAAYAPGDKIRVDWTNGYPAYSSGTTKAYFEFTVNSDGTTCTLTKEVHLSSGVIPSEFRNSLEVSIPGEVNGLTVTAIGDRCFDTCNPITKITIPQSVKKIGNSCFQGCNKLTDIDLGGVEEIGNNCFYHSGSDYQEKLTSVDLSNVKIIGNNSFNNFPNLKDVELSPELESLGTGCFSGCPNVNLEFPEASKYKVIDNIVYECTGTGADKTPQTLLMIQPNFKSTSVTVPATVISVAHNAFNGNTTITSIDLSNVTSVGNYAFLNCPNLSSISNTKQIETLGKSAFSGCTTLKTFEIGKSCTATAEQLAAAFSGCTGLTSFEVSDENPNVKAQDGVLFSKDGKTLYAYMCDNKESYSVPAGVTTIADGAFNNVGTTLTSLTFGNDVTTIGSGEYLFKQGGATNLTTLVIGSKVKEIGNVAFYNCPNVNKVVCFPYTPPTIPSKWIFSYYTVNNSKFSIPDNQDVIAAYKAANGWKDLLTDSNTSVQTGVDGIEADKLDDGAYYTLQGIRVDNPRAGQIYIHNGKKMIVR